MSYKQSKDSPIRVMGECSHEEWTGFSNTIRL
jgi:hypothetical protein